MCALRVAELTREFADRYGRAQLPDDDTGRRDARFVAHHLAGFAREPFPRILDWLQRWAPWMPQLEAAELADAAIAKPIKWRADTLGRLLGLTAARREALKIRTIGAVDQTKAEREAACRKRARAAKAAKRSAAGARPREQSAERQRPWEALGMCRTTWYQKRRLGMLPAGSSPTAIPPGCRGVQA